MHSMFRQLVFWVVALSLAILGYFFFGIVVAIYAGIWFYGDKMALAQGPVVHVIGACGALLGLALAWLITRPLRRTAST
ncbi:MAG: hypothetical protein FJ299_11525 [Planctomycetes bacterium]|nr:hypothetical protein [Planctomycetota bacterium]